MKTILHFGLSSTFSVSIVLLLHVQSEASDKISCLICSKYVIMMDAFRNLLVKLNMAVV